MGVETVRSRRGIASRAREGETLGQGEEGRRSGELRVLAGGVVARSLEAAMVAAAAVVATVEAVVWHDDGLQGHAWMQSLGAGCKDHIVIYTGDQNE